MTVIAAITVGAAILQDLEKCSIVTPVPHQQNRGLRILGGQTQNPAVLQTGTFITERFLNEV